VAGLLDLAKQVRGDEYGPPLGDQAGDQPAQFQDAAGVEAVHRLVQDDQFRVGQQAAGDAEPLPHPLRVGADPVVTAIRQPDPLKGGLEMPPGQRPADGRDHTEVLAAGEVVVEARFLDDGADAGQDVRASRGEGLAGDADRAAVGPGEAGQHAYDGRLARPVVAEEPERAAGRHAQAQVHDGRAAAEALGQAARLDDQGCGGHAGSIEDAGPAAHRPEARFGRPDRTFGRSAGHRRCVPWGR
jgi:hypothetical protein